MVFGTPNAVCTNITCFNQQHVTTTVAALHKLMGRMHRGLKLRCFGAASTVLAVWPATLCCCQKKHTAACALLWCNNTNKIQRVQAPLRCQTTCPYTIPSTTPSCSTKPKYGYSTAVEGLPWLDASVAAKLVQWPCLAACSSCCPATAWQVRLCHALLNLMLLLLLMLS